MNEVLDGDRIQASAARFLIDGGEEDAASVLLVCHLDECLSISLQGA